MLIVFAPLRSDGSLTLYIYTIIHRDRKCAALCECARIPSLIEIDRFGVTDTLLDADADGVNDEGGA